MTMINGWVTIAANGVNGPPILDALELQSFCWCLGTWHPWRTLGRISWLLVSNGLSSSCSGHLESENSQWKIFLHLCFSLVNNLHKISFSSVHPTVTSKLILCLGCCGRRCCSEQEGRNLLDIHKWELCHMEYQLLVFKRTFIMLFIMVTLIYSPTNSKFLWLHIRAAILKKLKLVVLYF